MLVSSLRRLRNRRGQFSLGGVKDGCCCAATVCVTVCASGLALVGATITVTGLGSCVTDATGCCAAPWLTGGSHAWTVTDSGGNAIGSGTQTFSAGSTNTIAIGSPTNVVCCGSYAIPEHLTLTDAAGTINFWHASGSSPPAWYGGHSVTKTSAAVTNPTNCVTAHTSSGPVRVCYQMTCNSGSSPVFSVSRIWSWVYENFTESGGSFIPTYYQDSTGFTPGVVCVTSPPIDCGSPHTDTADGSANPSSTSPFALSVSLTAAGGNTMADPVGGGVTISA